MWLPRLPQTCAWTKDFAVVSFTRGMLRLNNSEQTQRISYISCSSSHTPAIWLSPRMHRTAAKHWPWSHQSCTPSRCKGKCPSRVQQTVCTIKMPSNLCLQWIFPWSALWSRFFDYFCRPRKWLCSRGPGSSQCLDCIRMVRTGPGSGCTQEILKATKKKNTIGQVLGIITTK